MQVRAVPRGCLYFFAAMRWSGTDLRSLENRECPLYGGLHAGRLSFVEAVAGMALEGSRPKQMAGAACCARLGDRGGRVGDDGASDVD